MTSKISMPTAAPYSHVGEIYITANLQITASQLAIWYGGVWEQLPDSCYLMNTTSNNSSTIGENNHSLTVKELPSHTHTISAPSTNTTNAHSSSHNHTTPAHTHNIHTVSPTLTSGDYGTAQVQFGRKATGYSNDNMFSDTSGTSQKSGGGTTNSVTISHNHTFDHTHTINNTGGGSAIDMRPYSLPVKIFKRIA